MVLMKGNRKSELFVSYKTISQGECVITRNERLMRMLKDLMCRFEEGTKRRAERNVKRGSESREVETWK